MDFTVKDFAKNEYEMVRVDPLDRTDVTVNSSGGQSIRFRKPSVVANDSLSRIRMKFVPSASGNVALGNVVFKDTIGWLNRFYYYFNGLNNRALVEIKEFQNWCKVVLKIATSIEKFLALPVHGHHSTAHNSRGGSGAMFQKNNIGVGPCKVSPKLTADYQSIKIAVDTGKVTTITSNGQLLNANDDAMLLTVPGYDSWRPTTSTNLTLSNAAVGSIPEIREAPIPLLEPQYIEFNKALATDVLTNNVASPVIYLDFPLNLISGSWFTRNVDFYNPVEQILELTVGPIANVGFLRTFKANGGIKGTGDDQTFIGIPFYDATNRTESALLGGTLSEISFYYAKQINPMKIQEAMERNSLGEMIYFDYTSMYDRSFADATSRQVFDVRLTSNDGVRLKRIITACFNKTEQFALRYDMSQKALNKIYTYQTSYNGKKLQSEYVNIQEHDDIVHMKNLLKGSVLSLSEDVRMYNWVHVDSFGDERPICEQTDFEASGVPLSRGQDNIYTFEVSSSNSAVNYRFYCYYVTQKVLSIKGSEITIY